ncbi:hypothetical protein F4802DRAFT_522851 [Xylaria palmicola]|nr:hypothetical protein F4802DRAFT_522851 [Xylaria palmicola]
MAIECKNPRKIDRSHIQEVDVEVAWDKISEAVQELDMDDVKEAIQQYVKACPDTTYQELEKAFRDQDIGVYLIAMESQSMISTLTNMDLQGNLDKKYRVNYRFGENPVRPRERELWPSNPKENIERLADAGEPVSRGLTKCTNCNELGHISKNCPQEKMEKERVVIMCFNCNEPGHRMRDCKHMECWHPQFWWLTLHRPPRTCRQVRLQELRVCVSSNQPFVLFFLSPSAYLRI